MTAKASDGGTFTMAEDLTVARMGYGTMQLAGCRKETGVRP